MSLSIALSRVQQTQRDIQRLNDKLTTETRKEADETDKLFRAQQAAAKATSASTAQSKLRDAERCQKNLVQVQKNKAQIQKDIAAKTTKLHQHEQEVSKERGREQQKAMDALKRQQDEAERDRRSLLSQISAAQVSRPQANGDEPAPPGVVYDAFISYASEDREELVEPLARKLTEAGYNIWFDGTQLKVGDSLRRSIDRGLRSSRFGIVVFSPSFFAKEWPQYELDGLATMEISEGRKVILPLWHKVSKDEVMGFSPSLSDKKALSTATYTVDELVEALAEVLG